MRRRALELAAAASARSGSAAARAGAQNLDEGRRLDDDDGGAGLDERFRYLLACQAAADHNNGAVLRLHLKRKVGARTSAVLEDGQCSEFGNLASVKGFADGSPFLLVVVGLANLPMGKLIYFFCFF